MTNDKKAAQASTRTAPKSTAVDSRDSTANDPLKGWYSLAAGVKPSRQRKQKRGWQRKQRGSTLIESILVVGVLWLALILTAGGGAA